MTIFSSIPSVIALLAVILLHAAGRATNGVLSKIIKYVNIALHIPVGLLLVYLKAPVEEGVLFYMISLFAYLLFYYVRYRYDEKRGKSE